MATYVLVAALEGSTTYTGTGPGAATSGVITTNTSHQLYAGDSQLNLTSLRATTEGAGLIVGEVGTGTDTGSALQLASFTDTQRGYLTVANGMMIYNTTSNQFQVYENGGWTAPGLTSSLDAVYTSGGDNSISMADGVGEITITDATWTNANTALRFNNDMKLGFGTSTGVSWQMERNSSNPNLTLISSNAGASTDGDAFFLQVGDGGVASGAVAGNGGGIAFWCGNGGNAVTGFDAGSAGDFLIQGAQGGTAFSGETAGGPGSLIQIYAGKGGDGNTGTQGGSGGGVEIGAGNGGDANGGTTGPGGSFNLYAGSSADGAGGSFTMFGGSTTNGTGGSFALSGGYANGTGTAGSAYLQGGSGIGASATAGDAHIRGGNGTGGAADGSVYVGGSNTSAIYISNATDNPPTSFQGTGQVTFTGNVDATAGLDVTTAALTAAAGFTQSGGAFTFTGSNLNLDPTGTFDLSMDTGQVITFHADINLADSFRITDGTNDYLDITTTTGTEFMHFGSAAIDPDFEFLGDGTFTQSGTGQVSFSGNINATNGLDVTTAALTTAAGFTQSGGEFAFTGTNLNLDPTGTFDLSMNTGQVITFHADINLADAFKITDGTNDYLDITTTTGTEFMHFGSAAIDPDFEFLGDGTFTQSGTGQVSFSGNVNATNGLDVTTAALTTSAGLTQTGGAFTFTGSNLDLDPTGTFDLLMADNQTATIHADINLADAFKITDGTNDYLDITTTTGTEFMHFGSAAIDPDFEFLGDGTFTQSGTGQVSFSGNVNATNGLDVTTAALTSAAGFTQSGGEFAFTGTNLNLDPTGTFDLSMDASQTVTFTLADNLANSLKIQEGANIYIDINTTDASEAITLGNATTNPDITQVGTGQVSFTGNVDATNGLDVTTAALTTAAGFTQSGGEFAFTGTNLNLDPTGTFDLAMDASQTATLTLADNLANSLKIQEGTNIYIDINTTDASEAITLGNATTNPDITQAGTGQVTFTGNVDATNGLDVTTAALTAAAGLTVSGGAITFTGTNLDLDPTGTFALDMDASQTATITLADNLANAFKIQEGTNIYVDINTTDASEAITLGNATTNPDITQAGTGQVTFTGNVDATNGLDVTTAALTAAAGITQSGGEFAFTGTNVNLDPTGTFTLDMDASQTATITLADNLASAFKIQETANAYLDITTTDASEKITFGNATTNPEFSFSGSGALVNATGGAGLVVGKVGTGDPGGSTLQLASFTTTERDYLTETNGMIVYNETTGTFEFYENGAWQATTGEVTAPGSSGATGTKGQWAFSGTEMFWCVATDTWVKWTVTTSF